MNTKINQQDFNILAQDDQKQKTMLEHSSGLYIYLHKRQEGVEVWAEYEETFNLADISEAMAIKAVEVAGLQLASIQRKGWFEMGSEHTDHGYFIAEVAP